MKVNLAKSAGFCFGVKRALKIALTTAKSHKKVYMLGDIVHNEDVVRSINKAGIKKISGLTAGKNKILLIRAHGACLNTIRKAKRLGFKVVDATCPMVKEIHKIAKEMEKKNYKKSLLDEACKIVYLNFGDQAAQLYKAGLKDKAEKEIFSSLEESLIELVGPEHAHRQLDEIREKFSKGTAS